MEKHVGWDDKYKVGHNLIDSQHKQLFDIADKLYEVAYKKEPYRDIDISLILLIVLLFQQNRHLIIIGTLKLI